MNGSGDADGMARRRGGRRPRLRPPEISPQYEDRGLFRDWLGEVSVTLTPRFATNSRNDLIVLGFGDGARQIEVVFAGRRKRDAAALCARLEGMVRAAAKAARRAGTPAPARDGLRLPVRIEGSWRPRFQEGPDGWEERGYQLLAARWAFPDAEGVIAYYGQRVER